MAESADGIVPRRSIHALFVVAILAGSFLLFLVQPMIARMALPRLGGAPAVWNSAMLVYQALLLGGYAYAHLLGRVPARMQAIVHLAVLAVAALWLPIGLLAMNLPPNAEPGVWVTWLLGASIGPLFFAIAAQAPLLQRWYAAATGGRDPYALYAASNIGSFGGLIAYPLLVEPAMTLHSQSWLWTAGYALVFALIAGCALMLPRHAPGTPHVPHESPAPGRWRVAHWVVLALVPSGLMLATTTFLTTDIVAVPMLWVLPLGLYLLSFTVAFSDNRLIADLLAKFAPVIVLLFGATLFAGAQRYAYLNAAIGLLLLFIISVALHSRMYALRPAPDRLTGFYLAMSVGGALGGVFSALIAPIIFDWTYEYPLLIAAAGLLMPQAFLLPIIGKLWEGDREWARVKMVFVAMIVTVLVFIGVDPTEMLGPWSWAVAFVGVAVVGLLAVGKRAAFVIALAGALLLFGVFNAITISQRGDRIRSYFGVYTVTDLPWQRRLAHGTTLHGIQMTGELSRVPTTYYVPNSGVGLAMDALQEFYGHGARVGVVGLGTGTLACYARPGQVWRFFEIDPAVVRMSRDSGRFTFLPECAPDAQVVLGDARLRLGEMQPNSLDLLALDAFSSDAVPMHLMTAEAFQTYARVLAPDGLLLVHISNRYLALDPVVAASAHAGGWHAARIIYEPTDVEQQSDNASISDWIALSRDPAMLEALLARGGAWEVLERDPNFAGWTDDYASIMPVLRPPELPGF